MRRTLVPSVLALLFAWVPARAEPAARLVYLRGAGTESCPAETDLRQAVLGRLGYDPFSSYAVSTLLAEVRATASGFAAELKLIDGDNAIRGERVLKTTGACTDLMDAMALTISIAIDPLSLTRGGPPPGAPPQERPVEPFPVMDPDPTVEPASAADAVPAAAEPATRPDLAIAFGPVASIGAAPAAAIGAAIGVELGFGRTFIGLEGRADLPASAAADGTGHVASSLLACSALAGLRFGAFYVAGVGMVGRVSATATDIAHPLEQSALVGGAGLRFGIVVPLDRALHLDGRSWSLEARARRLGAGLLLHDSGGRLHLSRQRDAGILVRLQHQPTPLGLLRQPVIC